MGQSTRIVAIFVLCTTGKSLHAARLRDDDQSLTREHKDRSQAIRLPFAPASGLFSSEEDLHQNVMGELDVGDVHLTSTVAFDPYGEGARDHIHHHGHVRSLQTVDDDCAGIPSQFQHTVYIALDDPNGKLDSALEIEIFNTELQYTLNVCAGKCVTVEQVDFLFQWFFADRKRRRRKGRKWWNKAVIKAWAKGSCFQCKQGADAQIIADSMTRIRKLGGAAETGERRLQQSCGDILKRRLQRHGLEAFECVTVAELSLVDPRCELEDFIDDLEELDELRRLVEDP
uniref:Uncharacterized protein n=1 Tax=Pseudictyota dubia TaxID=2749911 RepID=A0A7R9Z539_9STRA|mmetsp:Transcript_23108/g.42844  ORF Transcript_23108/g.42844 Transcript_23108/m.42844 type:complete len:286 (+) Transcript_23108:69-926(+)